jgi:hypothetical protein
VLVVVGVVVIHVVVVAAMPLRFFKILAALARLSAVLAVAPHGVAQLILSLVNTLLTFFVSFVSLVSVVRPCWEGRAHQADRQQCKAKNSNHSGHVFSFMNRILSWSTPRVAVATATLLQLLS